MKKRIISFVLMLNIVASLSGCSQKEDKKFKSNNVESICSEESNNKESNFSDESNNSLDLINYDTFIEKINDIDVEYKNEEYYPTLDEIELYQERIDYSQECSNEEINYFNLYNYIKNNTMSKYEKSNGIFDDASDIKQTNIRIALKLALENIFSNATNNVKEDICRLKDASIIVSSLSGSVVGKWNSLNLTIIIDYDKIYSSWSKGYINVDFLTYLSELIEHEINHVRQDKCSCRFNSSVKSICMNDTYMLYGNSQELYLSLFFESSAEALLYKDNYLINSRKSSDYTYYERRDYETLLLMLKAFEANSTIDGYYNAILDSDLQAFWNYFNLKTDKEKLNFYRLLYSLDTLCGLTPLYKKFQGDDNNLTYGELFDGVGTDYRIQIAKDSVVDLIKSINNNNLELDDSLMLYLFIKSKALNLNIRFTKENKSILQEEYDKKFVDSVIIIEDEFLKFIQNKYNIDLKDLKEKLNSYELKNSLDDFMGYALGKEVNDENIDKFDKLLKMFPIIKYVLWTKDYDNSNYDIDVKQNSYNKKLIKQ